MRNRGKNGSYWHEQYSVTGKNKGDLEERNGFRKDTESGWKKIRKEDLLFAVRDPLANGPENTEDLFFLLDVLREAEGKEKGGEGKLMHIPHKPAAGIFFRGPAPTTLWKSVAGVIGSLTNTPLKTCCGLESWPLQC